MERERTREREPEARIEAHYEQLLGRWERRVQEARALRRVVVKGKDLALEPSPKRGTLQAIAIGGADFPSYVLDARVVEIPPGGHTSTHRHMADALMFIIKGKGYSVIGGQRHEWAERDSLHLPSWTWHQHWNLDQQAPARYVAVSIDPWLRAIRLSRLEDLGDAPYYEEPGTRNQEQGSGV